MELSGDYTFNAPKEIVWQALMDPEVLARVMPGCEKLEEIGENQYEGALKIKVGPVQGKFKGKVELLDVNEPDSYRMKVDGKGAPGFMKGEGNVELEAAGDTTIMHYSGKAQVGGKIASVGQRLMDSSAKALTKQSLDNLSSQIDAIAAAAAPAVSSEGSDDGEGGVEGEAAPPAAPPPLPPQAQAPSQTEFAMGVAKNMLDDVVPPDRQPLAIIAVLVVLAIIAYLIFV
ncbi:MAG: carbon monoxide dehydrogenase subunit G [Chloroflexota bacterium]